MNRFAELANPGVSKLPIYEPGRPIEEVARDLGFASADDVIKLASNENSLGPSPLAMKAMREAISQMHMYPDGGAYYLKKALAERLRVETAQIQPGHGSNELIELIGHAFLNRECGIVMADRAFVVYRLVATAFGASVVAVPMRDFAHDLDAMLAAIRPDTRIVFIGNPNNPTSTLVSAAAIDRFMARVPDHVIVCFDEAYIELLPPELQPDCVRYVREDRNAIVLRTFSKTYGLAGLRVGYAIAPKPCIEILNRVRQPFNVNAMGLAAAVAALDDEAHLRNSRQMVQEGIAYLQGAFDAMGLEYVPAHANFILVKVGQGREVFDLLLREGVIVRPMDPYSLPEYLRVTVGTKAENVRLLDALRSVLLARYRTGDSGKVKA
jgi:histidinol-phosphate aminotransferase